MCAAPASSCNTRKHKWHVPDCAQSDTARRIELSAVSLAATGRTPGQAV
jgi:hypothetical protein